MKKFTLTIEFSTVNDLAWFQRAIEKQLADRESQLGGATLSIAMSALRRAKGFKSALTETEARNVRLAGKTA